jgi:protein SCO1/2
MKALKKVLIVGAILLLPGIFYLLLIRGENRYKPLPVFGPRQAAPAGAAGTVDTLYHAIGAFSLTDQYGEPFGRDQIRGKIVVANFFFATCRTICPDMSEQLRRVQKKFSGDPDVLLLSHTVDPANDTVEALKAYSEKYGAVRGKWHFVTGDKPMLYRLASESYFLTAVETRGGPEEFIHSEQFVLLDKEGRIRGYYDGTDPAGVDQLMDEILVLKQEYKAREQAP